MSVVSIDEVKLKKELSNRPDYVNTLDIQEYVASYLNNEYYDGFLDRSFKLPPHLKALPLLYPDDIFDVSQHPVPYYKFTNAEFNDYIKILENNGLLSYDQITGEKLYKNYFVVTFRDKNNTPIDYEVSIQYSPVAHCIAKDCIIKCEPNMEECVIYPRDGNAENYSLSNIIVITKQALEIIQKLPLVFFEPRVGMRFINYALKIREDNVIDVEFIFDSNSTIPRNEIYIPWRRVLDHCKCCGLPFYKYGYNCNDEYCCEFCANIENFAKKQEFINKLKENDILTLCEEVKKEKNDSFKQDTSTREKFSKLLISYDNDVMRLAKAYNIKKPYNRIIRRLEWYGILFGIIKDEEILKQITAKRF